MIRILQLATIGLLLTSGPAGLLPPAIGADGATDARSLVYTVQPGDNLNLIASRLKVEAGYYSLSELLDAIRAANRFEGNLLRPGQRLLVPLASEAEPPQVRERVADGHELRGIYLTGPICGEATVFARVDSFVTAGGNAVVFDIKDIDGGVSFRSDEPLAAWGHGRSAPVISDVRELLRRLHARGLWVIARQALFLDGELGRQRSDLALHGPDGEVWGERGCSWMDPAQPEIQRYNIALALELARAGADEIQVDYVRFPTNGWQGDDTGDRAETGARRCRVIGDFLGALADSLRPLRVTLSADLYGIAAWGRVADLAVTGQDVPTIARHVDVICPMIYPSHFGPGFEGIANPADLPGYIVSEGVRRFAELAGDQARIRPWLQAFAWRVRGYGSPYVARQIEAATDAGASGWCLWNPTGRYETARLALRPPTTVVTSRTP